MMKSVNSIQDRPPDCNPPSTQTFTLADDGTSLSKIKMDSTEDIIKINEKLTTQLMRVGTLRLKTEPTSPRKSPSTRNKPPSSELNSPNESHDDEEDLDENSSDNQNVEQDENEDSADSGESVNHSEESEGSCVDISDEETHLSANSDQENQLISNSMCNPATRGTVTYSIASKQTEAIKHDKTKRQISTDGVIHDHMPCTKYSESASHNGISSVDKRSVDNTKKTVPPIIINTSVNSVSTPQASTSVPPITNKPIRLDWNQVRNSLASSSATDSLVEVLQNYILTQADIIQHLHESLQKKERQLAGVKQDREAYILRCANLEKRVEQLSKQTQPSIDRTHLDFTSQKEYPGTSDTQAVLDVTPDLPKKQSDENITIREKDTTGCQTWLDYTYFNSETGLPKPPKPTCDLTTKNSISESCKPKKRKLGESSKPSKPYSKSIKIYLKTDPIQKQPKVESITITPPSTNSTRDSSSDATACSETILTTKKHYPVLVSRIRALAYLRSGGLASGLELLDKECSLVNQGSDSKSHPTASATDTPFSSSYSARKRAAQAKIETPSFRINPIGVSHADHELESLDDLNYLKRHQKPEKEEIRRKRWDLQKLREQQYNARLRQGRYYNDLKNVNSETKKKNSLPSIDSFTPEITELQAIEIVERVPIVAFGFPIPKMPQTSFSLPEEWNLINEAAVRKPKSSLSRKHCDKYRTHTNVGQSRTSTPTSPAVDSAMPRTRPPSVKSSIKKKKRL